MIPEENVFAECITHLVIIEDPFKYAFICEPVEEIRSTRLNVQKILLKSTFQMVILGYSVSYIDIPSWKQYLLVQLKPHVSGHHKRGSESIV